MLPELHLVYNKCDTSCEKYFENEENKQKNMILPLVVQNESNEPEYVFLCAKYALILFGITSICLIITYAIYTYK